MPRPALERLRRLSPVPPPPPQPLKTAEIVNLELERFKRMLDAGWTIRAIAEKTGLNAKTLSENLRRHGIHARRGRPRRPA
jgi:hypothetical protein